jgi:hypothetical protein
VGRISLTFAILMATNCARFIVSSLHSRRPCGCGS